MTKEQSIITIAGAAGIGTLLWILTKRSPLTPPPGAALPFTPTLRNQQDDSVAFFQPPYTLPDQSNPAAMFAPFAAPSGYPSAVPAPVQSSEGPTYLTYNFGSGGNMQFPVLGKVDPYNPPNNTTLNDILGLLKPKAASNDCCGGCGSGNRSNCDTCSGGNNLASGPLQFLQTLLNTIPNFASQMFRNATSSGLPLSGADTVGNSFNGSFAPIEAPQQIGVFIEE